VYQACEPDGQTSEAVQLCLPQKGFNSSHLAALWDFCVWYSVLPLYASYLPQASEMKLVQTVYVTPVDGPSFTVLQKNTKHDSTVNINFASEMHSVLIPQSVPLN